ncbi:hypothetical protein GCM10020367_07930 [Streptomyces sannanensis]|uniref:ABC transporter domain-containing protein n=1 Tax=Streptomyces sannanensis TaxID=285536 RepID=A0ABP6S5D8_9ACTN
MSAAPSAARARGLTKAYGTGETTVLALDSVDVDIARGRFTAVMGPSGSGKSTLMHCLAGLDTVSAGQVWLGDTEITGLKERELTRLRRDRIGFVFQAFNLLPTLTAAENITLPMDIAGRRPDRDWLERTGMSPSEVRFAVLGVVNTLALSVVERTREIGLLRAIGLSRVQLRRMIRLESVVIAVFGALLGLGLGMIWGVAVQQVLALEGMTALAIPWGTILAVVAGSVVVGLVAAVLPALRASRMNVLAAIAHE